VQVRTSLRDGQPGRRGARGVPGRVLGRIRFHSSRPPFSRSGERPGGRVACLQLVASAMGRWKGGAPVSSCTGACRAPCRCSNRALPHAFGRLRVLYGCAAEAVAPRRGSRAESPHHTPIWALPIGYNRIAFLRLPSRFAVVAALFLL
jgi:hypothetical protein